LRNSRRLTLLPCSMPGSFSLSDIFYPLTPGMVP
jgi:hypothetical protein